MELCFSDRGKWIRLWIMPTCYRNLASSEMLLTGTFCFQYPESCICNGSKWSVPKVFFTLAFLSFRKLLRNDEVLSMFTSFTNGFALWQKATDANPPTPFTKGGIGLRRSIKYCKRISFLPPVVRITMIIPVFSGFLNT